MFFVILALFFQRTYADTASDNLSINVTVKNRTIVSIDPSILVWPAEYPGNQSSTIHQVGIENLGSTPIQYIWFNNTYPSSNPFGSGVASNYDAGNFVVVQAKGGGNYYFPARYEYNQSYTLVYVDIPSGWYYGRFRNASHEYFWTVDATGGNCSQDGTLFRIGVNEHNATNTGSVDLDPSDGSSDSYYQYALSYTNWNGQNWGYTAINVSAQNETYCVAVNETCDLAIFYHWAMDAPGAGSPPCNETYAEYWSSTPLNPGGALAANVTVRIPYGVMYGNVGLGYLYITVQT